MLALRQNQVVSPFEAHAEGPLMPATLGFQVHSSWSQSYLCSSVQIPMQRNGVLGRVYRSVQFSPLHYTKLSPWMD